MSHGAYGLHAHNWYFCSLRCLHIFIYCLHYLLQCITVSKLWSISPSELFALYSSDTPAIVKISPYFSLILSLIFQPYIPLTSMTHRFPLTYTPQYTTLTWFQFRFRLYSFNFLKCQQLKFTLNLLYGFRNDTSKLLVSICSTLSQFAV